MNKQFLIEKIKSQLKSLVSSKFAEQKAGEIVISTSDEDFVVGSPVYVKDEEGNNVELTDGTYTFDNGVVIVVEAGKIKTISTSETDAEVEIEAEEEVKEEEKVEEEIKAEEEVKEEVKEEDKVEELLAKIKMIEEKVEEMSKKFEEIEKKSEDMKQEFSKIAEQPSTSSIEPAVAEFKSVEEKTNSLGAVDIMAIREKARKNNR